MAKPKRMTVTQYAAARGVNRRTVLRWIRDGDIRAVRTRGGHWRIDARDLDRRWLTPRQFAGEVGVCYRTAVRWCESGKLAAEKRPGSWRIDAAEVARITAAKRLGLDAAALWSMIKCADN